MEDGKTVKPTKVPIRDTWESLESAVDRGIADVAEPGIPEAPDDVIPVRIVVLDDREHCGVEHSLQQLGGIHPASSRFVMRWTVPRSTQ